MEKEIDKKEKKEDLKTRITKNAKGYGYKYTDLAQIHEYLEEQGYRYYQEIITEDGKEYVYTTPIIDGKELKPRRGARVVDATLQGVKNPAQEQGSALTYARRYSLLMAFGLATEDDDAQSLSQAKDEEKAKNNDLEEEKKRGKDIWNKIKNVLPYEQQTAFWNSKGYKGYADVSRAITKEEQFNNLMQEATNYKNTVEEQFNNLMQEA